MCDAILSVLWRYHACQRHTSRTALRLVNTHTHFISASLGPQEPRSLMTYFNTSIEISECIGQQLTKTRQSPVSHLLLRYNSSSLLITSLFINYI